MRKLHLILIIVVIAIVAVTAIAILGGFLREKPSLLVTSQTLSGKTGETATLTFQISNLGGDATGVVIKASSSAFAEASTAKFDVTADKTVTATCQVAVNDMESKDYPITLTYTAEGNLLGAFSGDVVGNALFHTIPSLEIVNIHWANDEAWVGHYNNAAFYYNIKSNTNFVAKNIDVELTLQPTVANIMIYPSSMQITSIDPQITTNSQTIGVATYETAIGSHPLQIKLSSGGYEITSTTIIVDVR